jgi:hypothetical protein
VIVPKSRFFGLIVMIPSLPAPIISRSYLAVMSLTLLAV